MNTLMKFLGLTNLCPIVKLVLKDLSKLSTKEITDEVAHFLNTLFKDIVCMQVDKEGNATIKIKLSKALINYLIQEFNKKL